MTQVYRHFDENGRLLYVGISRAVSWRLMAHEKNSGWWRDVRTITVSPPYRSRAEALAAEAAIVAERPLFNQQHHPAPIKPPIAPAMAGKALLRRLEASRRKAVGTEAEAAGETFEKRAAAALAQLKARSTD